MSAGEQETNDRGAADAVAVEAGLAAPRTVLTLVYGPVPAHVGRRVPLGASTLHLNRSAPAFGGAAIDDADVSRAHAEVRPETGGHRVFDAGSRNGTFVDGQRVPQAGTAIRDGAVLQLGGTLLLVHQARVPPPEDASVGELLGISDGLREVRRHVARFAPSAATVLIQGESGTGKELCAAALARRGRPGRPFVAFSIADTPEALIEDRLFGHERGAFTGAERATPGVFRQADTGTLFIDEIGEAGVDIQAKLLRVLESGEVWPIGAAAPVKVRVRVVAATHRALAEAVVGGTFRGDLYARLRQLSIVLPPLAARLDDVPLIASHLLARVAPAGARLSARAMTRLLRHSWPFNVRELKAVVETAVVEWNGAGDIELSRALEQRLDEEERLFRKDAAAPADRDVVSDALSRTGGNMSAAADLLGKDRGYFYRLVKKLGLSPEGFRKVT